MIYTEKGHLTSFIPVNNYNFLPVSYSEVNSKGHLEFN